MNAFRIGEILFELNQSGIETQWRFRIGFIADAMFELNQSGIETMPRPLWVTPAMMGLN